MSQQNPTIIVGHLDDSELTKSIDKLVNEVANKTTTMAGHFTKAIGIMQDAMKDFAITQKVSVDLMKEAWRDMSKSFDAMVAAQSGATGGGKGSGKAHAPNTIGALEQEIAEIKQERKEMELNSDELRTQNALLERRKNLYKEQTTSPETRLRNSLKEDLNWAKKLPQNELSQIERKLKEIKTTRDSMESTGLFKRSELLAVNTLIDNLQHKLDNLRSKKPKSLNDVLGMDANSIDQIAAKMRALKMVRIDPNNAAEVKRVGDAYAELKRKQAQLMGQNIQLTHSNNYLAQSFGYIRNRIVYALTLGAITNFIKQLYEIRGQYELLERSLGVLVGSFEKGTQIFNELNEMAVKSPFTLIELGTAAKQLTAYNFAANEVVDTTRRLADISAALGVPMERLTYNLGQIKAQGVLNARDARDFANAGLAIVPMLAKMYTEQKTFGNEMVTTAKVYDMMSKKMVTYSDVLKVLYRVTDEGGKFFDFQAKQADTLRVQMANLTLAYNNMLNEIGSENQGLLTAWVSGLKTLLKNWKEISRAILTLVTTLGTYKAVATIVSALNSRMFVGSVLVNLRNYILGIKNATGAMATFNAVTKANPIAFLISALVAVIGFFALFNHKVKETTVEMERFGENASKQIKKVETLGKVLAGIEEGSSTYKKALSDLNQIVSEYGLTEIKNRDEINSKIQQTIQLIKEEGKERQYANNIAKGEERYINDTGQAKSSLNESLLGLEGWFGTTSKVRKEILDNAEAITDVASSIIEENINLVVNKTGDEAYKGLLEIQNKVRSGLKNSGLSESAIDFIISKGYVNAAIKDYRVATEEHERYNQKIKGYYDAATKATQSTMTFTEKINANARALRNNTEDALSLYNRIYDIVKIAKENHVINFDLKLSAEKPPKWMFDKSLPELQRLAERFTAIAQSGGHVKGYDRESTYERGLMYASAARTKQEEEERNARNKDHKTKTKQSDEIAKAIKNEISLVKELQGAYDTLTKKGDSHANAIAKVQDLYGKTIDLLNKDMNKFGLPKLDLSIIKGNNHNEVLAFFEKLRDVLESKGLSNLERMEAVEGVVKEFRLKAKTYNLDMITKGLNNELGKLKDEYELAVELDADPELGNVFADMFDLNVDQLPHSINEYAERVTVELNKALKERGDNIQLPTIYLTKDDIDAFRKMSEDGRLNAKSFDEILKAYTQFRELRQKSAVEVSKISKDYIREYGDLSAQIQQIEIEKNDALIKLNEIYNTDALRQTQRYLDAKFAIEDGARRKSAKATFEALKKESDYERFFTAIDTFTTKDALNVKNKIKQGIINAFKDGGLTVAQFRKEIKALEEQFDKLSESTSNWVSYLNGGFDKLIQRAKNTGQELEVIGEKMRATGKVDEKDKNFLNSFGSIFSDKQGNKMGFTSLVESFGGDIKGLGTSVSQAGQGMQAGASGFASAIAIIDTIIKNIHQTVQAIDSVIQELDSTRNEDHKIGNAYWEGFRKFDNYAFSGWENLKSGNIAGALADTANSIISIFNTFENAKNERINDEIKESERTVRKLELSYIDLEQAVKKAYGMATIGANMTAKANKELQLVELKRQLALERSRSSKNRDEERIIELQKQIKELEYDISNTVDSIINDLLGISSVGDAMESMMDAFVEALRSGEDAMATFDESVDEMIANMVKKMFTTKILQPWFEEQWNKIQEQINQRAGNIPDKLEKVQSKISEAKMVDLNDNDSLVGALRALGFSDEQIHLLNWYDEFGVADWGAGRNERLRAAYEKALKEAEQKEAEIQKELATATIPTTDDIRQYAELLRSGQPIMEENMQEVANFLRELGLMKDDANKNLSALQQGIQGITEDTAGALEAYMNGVSQQVYLQSTLLTQIVQTLQMFDVDVQTSTLGGILLQLQQSYQIQQSIQSILSGWSTPSGLAVRVEMN